MNTASKAFRQKAISVITASVLASSMVPATALALDGDTGAGADLDSISGSVDTNLADKASASSSSNPNASSASGDGDAVANKSLNNNVIVEKAESTAEVISSEVAIDGSADSANAIFMYDGLNFSINSENPETAAFAGWSGKAPEGDLVIPDTVVYNNATHAVTKVTLGGGVSDFALSAQVTSEGQNQDQTLSTPAEDSDNAPAEVSNVTQVKGSNNAPADGSNQNSNTQNETSSLTPSEAAAQLAASDEIAARFCAPDVKTIEIPASVTEIDTASFAAFPNATEVKVADTNTTYKSYNGALYDANLENLLFVPEGMEGVCVLPASLASVPACVFSRCTKLSATSFPGSTNAVFASEGGLLYSKNADADGTPDGTLTLVAAPAGLGVSAVIAPECTVIAEGAFWGNTQLATIVVNGEVKTIAAGNVVDSAALKTSDMETSGITSASGVYNAPDGTNYTEIPAFDKNVINNSTVAINSTGTYANEATIKAAWLDAGFTNFTNLKANAQTEEKNAAPENVSGEGAENKENLEAANNQENQNNGFAFTMLPDCTLAVSWANPNEQPNEHIVIPASGTYEGLEYSVTQIAADGFAGLDNIVSVETPNTLTYIGERAFSNCNNLTTLKLNNAIEAIDDEAFSNTAIKSLVLPTGLKQIGAMTLSGIRDANVVALNNNAAVDVSALANAENVKVYVPYSENNDYGWNIGVPVSGNRLMPYGVKMGAGVYDMNVGDTVNLYDNGGYLYAPGDICVTYSCATDTISIDGEHSIVNALSPGKARFSVKLTLDIPEDTPDGNRIRQVSLINPRSV